MRTFADLPGRVERLARERERVALVLIDGLGRRALERHADHPLLRRIASDGEIVPLASQFPSTTTAHLTTLYTGRPVGEHGLYEWRVYEPTLDQVIQPLPFEADGRPLDLDPRALVPGPTLFERLAQAGVPCTAVQPGHIWPSRYGSAALAGADVVTFERLEDGVRSLAVPEGLAYLYHDGVDAQGHDDGPSSPAFETAARAALDAVEAGMRRLPRGTLLVLTADHGQIDVSPDRLDLLDAAWPGLLDALARDKRGCALPPAGSARDCFLHIAPGRAREVVEELAPRLGDRAEVRLAADLVDAGTFGPVGSRLRSRLADVCVLPAPGRMAWLAAFPGPERRFRGHHGGLTPEETETWVALLET